MKSLALTSIALAGVLALAACVDNTVAPATPGANAPSLALSGSSRGAGNNGRHIVSFTGSVPAAFTAQVVALGGKVRWVSAGSGLAVVSGLSGASAVTLAGNQGIQAVDADEILSIEMPHTAMPEAGSRGVANRSANPARAAWYGRQWNMRVVQADAAWARGFLGSRSVTIYMLDSGIDYLHDDLVGRVDLTRSVDLLGTFDADMPDGSTLPFTEGDTVKKYFPSRLPFTDLFFHGTHTGATVSSNGVQAAGITSKTRLVAVKVCGYINQCPFSSILNGVIYGADNGADVMNLSLGGAFPKEGNGAIIRLINRIFDYAHRKGVTIVVSAGNEATDLDHDKGLYQSFCDTPGVICVAATGPLQDATGAATDPLLARRGPWKDVDAPAYYSNFGRRAIDIAAPGGNSSFGPALPPPAGRDTYVWAACSATSLLLTCVRPILGAQGTSMSAPHVAGTAALLVSIIGRNPDRIKERIQETADELHGRTAADFGDGRVNVLRAVRGDRDGGGDYASW